MTLSREQLDEQWGPMVRTARSVLRSRDEAEECAAAAVLQVLEKQPIDVGNMQAFMVTVAKRRAIDRLRALERGRNRDGRLAAQSKLTVPDVAEEVVARAEARWLAQEARERLDPKVYDLLEMVADGIDIADAAAAKEMTLCAAHSHLHRARKLLRQVWAKTLTVLGLTWCGSRRIAGVAGATAASAAVIVLMPSWHPAQLGQTPYPVAPGSVHLGSGGTDAAYDQQLSATSAVSPSPSRTSTRLRTRDTRTPQGGGNVTVNEPLGSSTTIEDDQHGSGEPDNLLEGAVDCVLNIQVDPSHVGC